MRGCAHACERASVRARMCASVRARMRASVRAQVPRERSADGWVRALDGLTRSSFYGTLKKTAPIDNATDGPLIVLWYPIHPSVRPSVHLSVHLSIGPSVGRSVGRSVHPSIHRSIDPPNHPSIHPSMRAAGWDQLAAHSCVRACMLACVRVCRMAVGRSYHRSSFYHRNAIVLPSQCHRSIIAMLSHHYAIGRGDVCQYPDATTDGMALCVMYVMHAVSLIRPMHLFLATVRGMPTANAEG